MSILNSILKAFVGDKSEKDVKAIQPLITKIKTFEASLSSLSHDELRAKTTYFKEQITASRVVQDQKIAALLQEVETTSDFDKKEDLYLLIDSLEKEAYENSEKTLLELLPEAFAVIKETAKRFKENTQVEVSATPKDIAL